MNLAKPEGIRLDMEAAERLAQYLREHPERASRAPEALAEEFGLPVEFVDEVIRYLQSGPEGRNPLQEALRDFRAKFMVVVRAGAEAVSQSVERPFLFLATVLLSTVILLWLASAAGDGIQLVRQADGPEMRVGNMAMVALLAFVVGHMSCYHHHGSTKLALQGTALSASLAFAAVALFGRPVAEVMPAGSRGFTMLAALVGTAQLSVLYAVMAVAVSIMGSAARMHQDGPLQGHSRQQLLERLMVLRERLEAMDQAHQSTFIEESRWRAWLCRSPYCATLLLASAAALLRLALHAVAIGLGQNSALYRDGVEALMSVAIIAIMVPLCYLSGSVRRGVVCGLLTVGIVQVSEWLPIADFGWTNYWRVFSWDHVAALLGGAAVLGLVAGLAAKVDERRTQDRRLLDRDPAAMVAEWIRIHWRISPHRTNVTVLAVDVKASSRMKAEADPLVAEYCFREYQKFVAQVSARWGGTVHATSGDGAVIAFGSPNEAFAAARAIQHEIEGFNRNVNRLPQSFRLRIGLHMGQVQGELDDVEFTEVIDIAAHVEAAAPVGDIAMTSLVAETLEGVRLAEMAEPVDGWTIFLARNPTDD